MHSRRTANGNGRGYRESSNSADDDLDRDSTYVSDEDLEVPIPAPPTRVRERPSPRRQSTRRAAPARSSLREPSSDEEFSESNSDIEDELDELALEEPAPKRRRVAPRTATVRIRRSKPPPRATMGTGARPRRPSRAQVRRIAKPKATSKKEWIPTDGKPPPWTTLPYHIVLMIFDYAYQLENSHGDGAATWAARAAKTCKAFMEPALAALYRKPQLNTGTRIVRFALHMSGTREHTMINYRPKVKSLSLEERIFPTNYDPTTLIGQLPQLAHVEFWSEKDRQFRGNANVEGQRYWKYPTGFLESPELRNLNLRSFHFNSRMLSANATLPDHYLQFAQLFQDRPFKKMEEVTFTNFNIVSSEYSGVQGATEFVDGLDEEVEDTIINNVHNQALALGIQELAELRRLRFEFSPICSATWLRLLPKTLTTLELHCCISMESVGFEKYLSSHGNALNTLILDHNHCLNLDFLPTLKSSCPKLEMLSMELLYFRDDRVETMIRPGYSELLSTGAVPTWPSTLQNISLSHLRQCDGEMAIVLFESLINEAEHLSALRHLSISASVEGLHWQERAGFRDKWKALFERVFLIKKRAPLPYLQSFKTHRLWLEEQNKKPKRTRTSSKELSDNSSSEMGRLRPRNTVNYASDDSSEEGNSLRGKLFAALGGKKKLENAPDDFVVQGLCDVVDIRIDNGRPTEKEFRESDLLDSEQSGDSDFEE